VSVLMIAPTRSNLPNVAIEAAAVVNALGGKLVQGPVTERDVRDAASAGTYDGIWFATHADGNQVLLSDGFLSEAALVAYVAASGASWCFLNTCQSIALGKRLIDQTQADVICTITDTPDGEAMRTGVLFARQLSLLGDSREAYERSKPGDDRNYLYLDNYRQRQMAAIGSAGGYPAQTQQQDRLQTTMDDMRRDMGKIASDVEVLKTRTGSIESRNERIETRLTEIERLMRPPMSAWPTWTMLLIGLVISVGLVILLLRVGG
jgi:hypothetical protein